MPAARIIRLTRRFRWSCPYAGRTQPAIPLANASSTTVTASRDHSAELGSPR